MYEDTIETFGTQKWKRLFEIRRDNAIYTVRHDGPKPYKYPVELEDRACFQLRNLTAAIFREQDYIGFVEFYSYKLLPTFTKKNFVWDMDALDGDTHELAQAFGCWSKRDLDCIIALGPLLEFHRVWIRREYRPCFVWVDAAEHLINTVFRQHSIMMMLAAPMEMKIPNDLMFKRNRTAEEEAQLVAHHERSENHRSHMIRAYKRLLGVESLPGSFGQEGWLWRPRRTYAGTIGQPKRAVTIDPYD